MYQNIYYQKSIETIHLWDDTDGYMTLPYTPYAYVPDAKGEYLTITGIRASKVTTWPPSAEKLGLVFEHDVRAETRTLIDHYFESDEVSSGHRILFLDIEIIKGERYSKPNEASNIINSISFYASSEKKYYCLVLDTDNVMLDRKMDDVELRIFNSEAKLLAFFLHRYEIISPTIITGWNTDYFDMPYLFNRIRNVLGDKSAKRLSPIKIVYDVERGKDYSIKIAGVSQLDYLQLYKNFNYNEEPRYTLDAISKKELKRGKVEYKGSLDNLFREDIDKFIRYNVSDVELVVALDQKLDFIELARGICHKSHVAYEEIYKSSRWLDGALLTRCRKGGLVSVATLKDSATDAGQAEGAFVKLPKPGIHKFVYDLDLESEYPNNIKSLNISPETKWGRVFNFNPNNFASKKDVNYSGEKIQIKTFTDNWDIQKQDTKFSFDSHGDFLEFIDSNNLSISSAGILYSMDKKGLIPMILEEWGLERAEYRKIAKQYHNDGNKDMYKFFDKKQLVQKIMLNSLYGVLLLPSFRFYDKENGESVTLTGQTLVQFSANMGNAYYNNIIKSDKRKDYCIYQDTDSCFFVALPIINHRYPDAEKTEEFLIDKTLEIAKEVEDYINKAYDVYALRYHNIKKHTWRIKQEMVGKSAFWRDKKKRYAMHIVNKNGLKVDELEIKGFDSVRSDFPKDFRNFMSSCIEDILYGRDNEYMNKKIVSEKSKIINECNLTDIMLPTSVKEITKFEYGAKGVPAHIKSAQNYNRFLQMKNLDSYPSISDGDKILWTYLKPNPYSFESIAIRGYDDPEEITSFVEAYADRDEIFTNRLLTKLEKIWENLGWELSTVEEQEFF